MNCNKLQENEIELDGYTIKTIYNKSQIPSDKELDKKIGPIDVLIPIHGTTDLDTIRDLIKKLESTRDMKILYVHRYMQDNITTLGVKDCNKKIIGAKTD